jgi:hypothetical protein
MKSDPLTHRFKHEAREIDPDPLDWFEGPEPQPRTLGWVLGAISIAAVVAIVLFWVGPR